MNRPTMLHNLKRIMEHAKRKRNAAEQTDMFGGAQSSDLIIEDVPDWSLATKLWYERKTLGVFLSGHPVDDYKSKFERKITHHLRDVPGLPQSDWPKFDNVIVCGLVEKVFVNRYNTGIILSDDTGQGEIKMERDAYERAQWVLRKDFIVAVKCKVKRDGQWSCVLGLQAHKIGEFTAPSD